MKNSNWSASLALALFLGVSAPVAHAEEAAAKAAAPAQVQVPVADPAEAQKARQALDEFIRAYEAGNIGLIRSKLDPGMIGYQRFIDGMIQDTTQLKQIRLHLLDTQTIAGPDVAVIQTSWEKRFLSVGSLTPGLFTGRSDFLLHRGKDGWRVAAIGGDNPFAGQSGVLGQIALTNASTPAAPAVRIEVVDPDMAGRGALSVSLTDQWGTRTIMLMESGPGRFWGTSPLETGGLVTVRYLDNNPGGGRPPSVLSRTLRIP